MKEDAVIKQIDELKNMAMVMLEKATQLKKSLSPVKGRTSRKGSLNAQTQKILNRRYTRIIQSKPND